MAKNRAFVRYTKSGKIVPGSMIVTNGSYPKNGTYVEVFTNECCNPGNPGGTSLPLKAVMVFVQGAISKGGETPIFKYTPGQLNGNNEPEATGPETSEVASEKGAFYCVVYRDDSDYPRAVSGSVFIKEAGDCKPVTGRNPGCYEYDLTATTDCVFSYLGCQDWELTYEYVLSGNTITVCADSTITIPYIVSGTGTVTDTNVACT